MVEATADKALQLKKIGIKRENGSRLQKAEIDPSIKTKEGGKLK
jgi:hypothetical protein